MDAKDLDSLLGHAFTSEPVQQLVRDWEQLEYIDEEDLKKARIDRRLSLINRERGLYLFFTDARSYVARYGPALSPGDLVLCRVIRLLYFQDSFRPYAGPLPLGCDAADKADDVMARLEPPSRQWLLGDRVCKARWTSEGRVIDVSFRPDDSRLRLISVTLPDRRPPNPDHWKLPRPETIRAGFGLALQSLELQRLLDPLPIARRLDEIRDYGEADFSADFGLELFFMRGEDFPAVDGASRAPSGTYLSGVRYRTDLDFQSDGYQGPLPAGLEFDFNLELTRARLEDPPLEEAIDERDGYQLWRLDGVDLHVLYSFLEDRIYRVTLMVPGCDD